MLLTAFQNASHAVSFSLYFAKLISQRFAFFVGGLFDLPFKLVYLLLEAVKVFGDQLE
jgi:hypothetical protein